MRVKNGRFVGFYTYGPRYDNFKERVPAGKASAFIDDLIAFYLDNEERFKSVYGGYLVGQYMEFTCQCGCKYDSKKQGVKQ